VTRDMDLIRELLLKLESLPIRPGGIAHITPDAEEVRVPGYSVEQIDYHLMQMRDAGLIDEGGVRPMIGIGFRKLTWSGHDLLDSIRGHENWAKTKNVAKAAGGFTVDILKELAKGLLKQKIAEISGVSL
jgi:hypothetical protein